MFNLKIIPMIRLQNKVAIITGGATGIGEAICKKFTQEGARVVVVGMPDDPVDRVVEEIRTAGSRAIPYAKDIAIAENAEECVKLAVEEFGALDILINNAGVFPEVNEIDEYSEEAIDLLLKNNIKSAILMTKYAIPELKKTKGTIICAGSEAGKLGIPQVTPYGGTKGFLHAFAKGLAAEQAKYGIRVNCVCPGAVDTAWTHRETSGMDRKMEKLFISATPMGRRATPEEIANAYLFLASEEASFITGELLFVDGGITISKGSIGKEVKDRDMKTPPEGDLELEHTMEGNTKKEDARS